MKTCFAELTTQPSITCPAPLVGRQNLAVVQRSCGIRSSVLRASRWTDSALESWERRKSPSWWRRATSYLAPIGLRCIPAPSPMARLMSPMRIGRIINLGSIGFGHLETPHSPSTPLDEVELIVTICTGHSPAFLYRTTEVEVRRDEISVRVHPDEGSDLALSQWQLAAETPEFISGRRWLRIPNPHSITV